MRMLLNIKFPLEPFNQAIRDGSVSQKVSRILQQTKPEAVYFLEQDGQRGAMVIIDLPEPSKVPAFAEPWFLTFNAEVQFHVVMSPEDLQKAGLEELGKAWS